MTGTSSAETAATDGRDSRWDDHRQARRERVLATAAAMIDRDGPGVSVPAIAAEAGIPRSVVYKLFRDREDLDRQISSRTIDQITADLLPHLSPTGTPRSMIRGAVTTYVDWVAAHPRLHVFLGRGSARDGRPDNTTAAGGKDSFGAALVGFIDQVTPSAIGTDLPTGLSRDLAYAAIGLADNVVNHWVTAGGERSSKDRLIAFLTDALCALAESAARTAGGSIDLDRPLLG